MTSAPSVFARAFDCVVCGAGLVGYAAARRLAAAGLDTLLVEPSADLLWESSRALENSAAAPAGHAAWHAWIDTLRDRGDADRDWFEPAIAEILAADHLARPDTKLRALLHAHPVALELAGGVARALVVATKNGPRRIRARRWIDATETGLLARLADPRATPRAPASLHRGLVLHSLRADALDLAVRPLLDRHPGLEWLRSRRLGERRLRWTVSPGTPWHRRTVELLGELRALLASAADAPDLLVSHCAMRDYPIYAAALAPALALPANLVVLSPSLRPEPLATPAERFTLGDSVPTDRPADLAPAAPDAPASLPAPAETLAPRDVVVAGVGTGGAAAVIAAAREGARVLALEFTALPGGVGTGGGINGYFHGAPGGLQDEIDRRVRELDPLLAEPGAHRAGWHHESKKIVLHQLFEECGAEFLGDALLCGVERDGDGRVLALLVAREGRLLRVPAAAFIDGTGDGDLCVLAGAETALGRPGDGRPLSFSQSAFGVVPGPRGVLFHGCNFDAGWVDPADPEDLTRARLSGIAQHLHTDWTREHRIVALAPVLGLRQARQILTDRDVAFADLIAHARFEDSIGEVETVADTHSVDFEFESDELAFYYWTCRGFRHSLRAQLPYRMLLPRGLANVWIACRAAGVSNDAFYGLRMQREMQRFGEAAGIAAARAAAARVGSREIDLPALLSALDRSGSRPAEPLPDPAPDDAALLAALDQGRPGVHLWRIQRAPERHRAAVRARLDSSDDLVSFQAAAILALWSDPEAEPRLLRALEQRETGPALDAPRVPGAFAQCIDLPAWLQAVVLLRRVGTAQSLPALRALAEQPRHPLNIRTILALTLERLAPRVGPAPDLVTALDALVATPVPDPVLPPSRSLWFKLEGLPQKQLGNDRGAPVDEDHTWQLHLVVARARRALGLPAQPAAAPFARDPRALVRRAFAAAT